MQELDENLRREVKELKAEVRRLRRMVEAGFVLLGIAVAIFFPGLLLIVLAVAMMILFAFLVSPVRGLIFSSLLQKPDRPKTERL